MKIWRKRKRYTQVIVGLLVLGATTAGFSYWYVSHVARPWLYSSVEAVPYHPVGLVLGTAQRLQGGHANPYFTYRINAAAALFHAGKVRHLLVSGDNRTHDYNEPAAMRAALRAAGVPDSCIAEDFAGLRTLDSVVRCQQIFGQNQFIVISQPFHNQRAVFIARQRGAQAVGFNASDVSLQLGLKVHVREVAARLKAFLDVFVLHTQPKHLGDPIRLPLS
jgi:SanA protein